ncbi:MULTISPECIES: hypothetical protein [unclassified Rathayibacter]|uniref:hypothetical protein n=1 Tax=unclassified Rathayibacter TaxID=2609250 RepID=UPI001049D6A9|nr:MULTISPECIES: hypothetical protein [unclassified Rathayibacter]TCL84810.1 hypothetical protein EDF49_102483 [Rathayibacter sp. PhB192]TCM30528.1 hypothetical protein EDF43_102483 [Rathayibacter sp. PhB179]
MLTISTPAQTAHDDLTRQLEQLDRQRISLEQSALAGNVDGASLARFDDERALVAARLSAARRALEQEDSARGPEADIRAAISEMLVDPALSTEQAAASIAELNTALEQVLLAFDARNTAVREWAARLHKLGIPRDGLEIDGVPITVRGGGAGEWGDTEIVYGGNRISSITGAAPFVKAVTDPITTGEQFTQQLDALARHDRRDQPTEPEVRVRLVKDSGGHTAGDVLTSHKLAVSSLRHLISAGNAVEIDPDGNDVPTE